MPTRQFRFHWISGSTEIGSGPTVVEAFTHLGYGAGAIGALDYYEEIDSDFLCRIIQLQNVHGELRAAILFPCQCGRFTVEEWYAKGNFPYHKERAVINVANVDEARVLYRPVFGELKECVWDSAIHDYTNRNRVNNFVVTGRPHLFCKKCQ